MAIMPTVPEGPEYPQEPPPPPPYPPELSYSMQQHMNQYGGQGDQFAYGSGGGYVNPASYNYPNYYPQQ